MAIIPRSCPQPRLAGERCALLYTAGPELRTETVASDEGYHLRELLDLYVAIVEDRAPRTPIREGALSLELALAARRSAEAGSAVTLLPYI